MNFLIQRNLEKNLNTLQIWRKELPRTKIIISILIFSFLLFITSIVKNKTRVIEKNIISYEKKIFNLEKELYESQLDFYYLSSPQLLQKKLSFFTNDHYQNMDISNIYLDLDNFILDQKKITQK